MKQKKKKKKKRKDAFQINVKNPEIQKYRDGQC